MSPAVSKLNNETVKLTFTGNMDKKCKEKWKISITTTAMTTEQIPSAEEQRTLKDLSSSCLFSDAVNQNLGYEVRVKVLNGLVWLIILIRDNPDSTDS